MVSSLLLAGADLALGRSERILLIRINMTFNLVHLHFQLKIKSVSSGINCRGIKSWNVGNIILLL